jgi:hypothetical protein
MEAIAPELATVVKRCVPLACAAVWVVCAGFSAAKNDPASSGKPSAPHLVVVCQALGNGGWNRHNTSANSILKDRHAAHKGADIIPPFDYDLPTFGKGRFEGHRAAPRPDAGR